MFKELLNLPIPFDPAGLIPAPIDDGYAALRSAISHGIAAIKNLFAY
jgi:hypothetical protein